MDDLEMLDWHIYDLQLHLFNHTGTDYYINSSDMGKVDSLRAELSNYVLEKGLLKNIKVRGVEKEVLECDHVQGGLHVFWVHLLEGEEKESN